MANRLPCSFSTHMTEFRRDSLGSLQSYCTQDPHINGLNFTATKIMESKNKKATAWNMAKAGQTPETLFMQCLLKH